MLSGLRAAFVLAALLEVAPVRPQDYDVSDIQCSFASSAPGHAAGKDSIAARLRKPEGFRGHPLFADDRQVDPLSDQACRIRPDPADPTELTYDLLVSDFGRCGVLKRNGFVHVRVWFPQFPGVVMMSDQELIIMCKPPEPTVIENKAAGFAGSFPSGARVSGVVEETPGRLEYEVALYKEAPPVSRLANKTGATGTTSATGNSELPVDQAVPIGTKLQLRARINPDSAWKYVKLMEVTVSPDPDDPHSAGSVALVKDGCRNRDFATIIPHQPARYRERHNEVFLDFEAFLLSTMRERATLWIHSQIKACMDAADCQPEYCLDLFEPAGHGRRRRRREDTAPAAPAAPGNSSGAADDDGDPTQFAKFAENIEYTVLMPGDFYHRAPVLDGSCSTFLAISSVLGCLLLVSTFVMCYLASRLHSALGGRARAKTIDQVVRDHHRKYLGDGGGDTGGYTGRNTVQ
ncbi:uncharacterized protein LOC134538366 [Bacillus rossius redtenbacheri]|uniref:uncharacterized protein LOC134538366 n=1 Tax=Bacillus rossius redtenbacheri TaxID=93214 RepID=UPI002FDD5686